LQRREKIGLQSSFRTQPATEKDPTIRKGEATNMVSRDNHGGTALERNIIRWNFESDPRGPYLLARYLQHPRRDEKHQRNLPHTMPYEETRAFNILGLTYENSRDVTIEIKMRRKGYYD
jgi:hypothetical protein